MMKKKVWLVLLAVVLVSGLVMFGCGGNKGDDGKKPGGGEEIKNPVAGDAKFFKITKRTNDYFTLDIKAGKDGNDAFAAGKAHTITVYGNAKSGSDCMFANTDDPWAEKTPKVKSDADGMFTIEREFSAAELADTAQNIRIKIQQTVDFYIYEITIVDEDDTAVFTMSTDAEIQALASGDYFTSDAEDTAWLKRAGTPKVTVMVPGESAGGGDEGEDPDLTPEEQEAAFNAAVGIKALTTDDDSDAAILKINTTTGVISRDNTTAGDYGKWISIAIPSASLPVIASDTIKITYIAVGDAPLTPKKPDSTTDINVTNKYPTLKGNGTPQTYEIPAAAYGTDMPEVVTFQSRPPTAAWKLKVISIEVVHGDPIKIALAIPLSAPVGGLAQGPTTISTDQYTGNISWSPVAAKFATGQVYTATIILTKIAGYTFAGIAANSFTAGGTAGTNDQGAANMDAMTVIVAFPAAIAVPEKVMTFAEGDVGVNAGGATVELIPNGYKVDQTNPSHGTPSGYAYFKVKFDTGVKLSNYTKVDVTANLVSGDTNYKNGRLAAFASAPSGYKAMDNDTDTAIIANKTEGLGATTNNGPTGNKDLTFILQASIPAEVDLNEVYIVINFWSTAIVYELTNIKFYN